MVLSCNLASLRKVITVDLIRIEIRFHILLKNLSKYVAHYIIDYGIYEMIELGLIHESTVLTWYTLSHQYGFVKEVLLYEEQT